MFPQDSKFSVDQISRTHLIVARRKEITFVVNKSGNGTFVNGDKLGVGEQRLIRNGDRVSILSQEMELFWYIDRNAMMMDTTYPVKIVSKYIVGNVVGEGVFGTVRKAYSKDNLKPVALKFINKKRLKFQFQMRDEDLRSITNEVKILQKIDHPCVTDIIEAVHIPDMMVIVMDFVEGGELEKFIELERLMGRLSEPVAKFQFYQICHTVAYLHSINICHRDLKLSNILMSQQTPECLLKVSDFGISKIWTDTNLLRTKVGTPKYWAPEVNCLQNYGDYTSKADCWSLGIILYRLLCGKEPHDFGGKTDGPEWEKISDKAKDLVSRLLVVDPSQRLEAAEILHHPWFISDPLTCNRSRNMMFQTEDSLHMSSASFMMAQVALIRCFDNCSNPNCSKCLEVNFHNTNINSSEDDKADPSKFVSLLPLPNERSEGSSNFNLSLPPVSSDKSPEVASSQNPTNSECSVESKIDSKDEVEVSSVESMIDRKEEVKNSKDKEINVDEENLNFENIKSRLRPRNENINYYKVNIVQSPVANKTNHDEKPRAFKRKDNEMKQGSKRYF